MKPVQRGSAVAVGVAAAVVFGVIFQLIANAGSSMPRHSWGEGGIVLAAIVALFSSGWPIRRYVRSLQARDDDSSSAGDARAAESRVQAPSPETARRTLVLAQAAALGGAVLTGWYVGQALTQLSRWNVPSVHDAVIMLVVLSIEGVGLAVAGFVVQQWCILPEDQR